MLNQGQHPSQVHPAGLGWPLSITPTPLNAGERHEEQNLQGAEAAWALPSCLLGALSGAHRPVKPRSPALSTHLHSVCARTQVPGKQAGVASCPVDPAAQDHSMRGPLGPGLCLRVPGQSAVDEVSEWLLCLSLTRAMHCRMAWNYATRSS